MTRIPSLTAVFCAGLIILGGAAAHAQPSAPIRLTVVDAVTRAFDASHRLAEIRARERGAQAAVRGAQAGEKPIASASAGYSRTNHVEEFGIFQGGVGRVIYPDIPDNVTSRVSVQWPIYTSGRVDALERAAQAEVQALGADLDTARADLRFETVRAYWAAATAREAARVIAESMGRAEAQLKDARQRFDVGLIPPNEVSSLEAQHSRERAQLIEARNIVENTSIDLRRLIGAEADAVIELADGLTGAAGSPSRPEVATVDAASAAVKEALTQRPERKALTLRIGVAEAREQAALAASRPTIAVGGGYDFANPNPRIFPRESAWQDSWDASVNVTWPFFDSGRSRAQAAEAAAIAAATRERLRDLDTVIAADVRQRLLDVESAQAMVEAATDAVRSATEARRIVGDRFAAGVATSTDVLVAQVALLEIELARTRAQASVKLAEARLQRVVGKP